MNNSKEQNLFVPTKTYCTRTRPGSFVRLRTGKCFRSDDAIIFPPPFVDEWATRPRYGFPGTTTASLHLSPGSRAHATHRHCCPLFLHNNNYSSASTKAVSPSPLGAVLELNIRNNIFFILVDPVPVPIALSKYVGRVPSISSRRVGPTVTLLFCHTHYVGSEDVFVSYPQNRK